MFIDFPGDFGPIYAETIQGRFPVEPWNTFSNLIFLVIALRFASLTQLNAKNYPLIVFSLPILFAGFIGGTIYHATRSHNVWLFMDFIPITILALATTTVLWGRVLRTNNIVSFGFILLALLIFRRIPFLLGFERSLAISLNYALLGLLLLLPAFIHSWQHAWRGGKLIVSATILFGIAVSARILDSNQSLQAVLPMGSHFLWHLFGGFSVWCLMEYLFRHLSSEKSLLK